MRVLRISHSAVVDAWRERERALVRRRVDVHLLCARVWDEAGAPVRLEPREGDTRAAAFDAARAALARYLQTQGVADVAITLSPEAPKQHPGSGKFKHICTPVSRTARMLS